MCSFVSHNAMATSSRSRKHVKPERRIRLVRPVTDGMGALLITVDGEPHTYLLSPVPSDFGSAFLLVKQELAPIDPGVFELKDTARYYVVAAPGPALCRSTQAGAGPGRTWRKQQPSPPGW
jgi:hypothetical protein